MLLQVPAGVIIEYFGSRWIVSAALLTSSLINILTPFITDWTVVFIASRVILGAAQAGVFPGCFKLGFNWFPLNERSFAFSLLRVGAIVGSVLISLVTGFICASLGWEVVFFISATVAFVSSVAFAILTTNTPEEHPLVSVEEILLIRGSKSSEKDDRQPDQASSPSSIPWTRILTNLPVWINGLYKFSHFWIFFLLASKLPTYLADEIEMDIRFNGVTNGIFCLSYAISLSITGYASDRVIESGIMSRTTTRKVFASIAGFGSGIAVIMIPVVGKSVPLLLSILVFSSLSQGFSSGGDVPLPGEMSKKYPATIFSLVNMMSMVSGSVAPMTVGFVLKRSTDMSLSWTMIFTASGILSIACTVLFLMLASAERQPFDFDDVSQCDPTTKGPKSVSICYGAST